MLPVFYPIRFEKTRTTEVLFKPVDKIGILDKCQAYHGETEGKMFRKEQIILQN